MAGYIAITTNEWLENIKAIQAEKAVFWSKKASFRALRPGEAFYFLRRAPFATNADRMIAGKGVFKQFQRLSPDDAWNLYEAKMGFDTKDIFLQKISSIFRGETQALGCILLENIQFFSKEISLESCNVEFSPYIVSGRTISENECNQIEKQRGESHD